MRWAIVPASMAASAAAYAVFRGTPMGFSNLEALLLSLPYLVLGLLAYGGHKAVSRISADFSPKEDENV